MTPSPSQIETVNTMHKDSPSASALLTIDHVTLTTGRACRHARESMSSKGLAAVQSWLSAALAADGQPVAVPGFRSEGHSASASVIHGGLKVTVYGHPLATPKPPALATFAVALRHGTSGRLWDAIVALPHDYPTDPKAIPARPRNAWCAGRLHQALVKHPSVAVELGEFECLVAWAWADLHGESINATLH